MCNTCAKMFFCDKKNCKPVKWSETANYGVPERKRNDKRV